MSDYNIDVKNGLIAPARVCLSPNRDARPSCESPDLLVLHGISLPPGEFGGDHIEQLFCNRLDWDEHPYFGEIRGLEVSAHLLIRRNGELLQFVPFNERAWHAGQSCYRGRTQCNDFSIGIELEGEDETPYTERQYTVVAAVFKAIRQAYPAITPREVVGHCDIAPGRKTDPGPAFDWMRLYDAIGEQQEAAKS